MSNKPVCLYLTIATLLALLLRVLDIFWHPFGPDEFFTVSLASSSWSSLLEQAAADTHPPFHYMMVKVWFFFVGEGYFQARAFSALFSAACIPLVFWLARRWFGDPAAWCAVAVAVAAPYQVYWGHVARIHSIFPTFVMGMIVLSYSYLDRPTRMKGLGLALLWLVSIPSNYMSFVFGLIWGVVFVLRPGITLKQRAWLAATPIPGILAFIPWTIALQQQMDSGPMNANFWQDKMTPISLYYRALFGQMTHLQPPHSGVMYLVALLIFVLLFMQAAKRVGPRWDIWFLLLALPGLPMLIAYFREWTLAERHLLFSIPVFNAFIGAGIWASIQWARERFLLARRNNQENN